jgi:hypothetical protein
MERAARRHLKIPFALAAALASPVSGKASRMMGARFAAQASTYRRATI